MQSSSTASLLESGQRLHPRDRAPPAGPARGVDRVAHERAVRKKLAMLMSAIDSAPNTKPSSGSCVSR